MATVKINFDNIVGKMKPMHAVNNGPVDDGTYSNMKAFSDAKIPYVRNHDASIYSGYGGEHCVDVHAIFPDFTKNPYDIASYDFTLTDEYTAIIYKANSKVFYRLGTKIEHWTKKYGTIVPADFHKWAVVAEHIIRHYTQGWANGFHYDMEYWEIWNEADGLTPTGDQPNWSGTPEEYQEFYIIVANHLKQRFPDLKIGGPAFSFVNVPLIRNFLAAITKDGKRAPLDFFSWHRYTELPHNIAEKAEIVRGLLDEYGYYDTESILDEYNYIENFQDRFIPSVRSIISMKGAAYNASAFASGQYSTVDMLMYYDARPCLFNGLFDFYSMESLKGYYPFLMFSKLYELGSAVEVSSDDYDVFVVAATDCKEKKLMLSYYLPHTIEDTKSVTLQLGEDTDGEWKCYFLDEDRTMEETVIIVKNGEITIEMPCQSVLLLEKIL